MTMLVLRGNETAPEGARGAVAAIGNFDGVHRGHRAVIAETAAVARQRAAPLGIITFEPHPRQFMRPGDPPFRLTPFASKARLLAGLGVERLYALDFNEALRSFSPEDFVGEMLHRRLGLAHVVVGEDFTFGRARTGGLDLLRQEAARHSIGLSAIGALTDGGAKISSSSVRDHLRGGRPREAAALLGHDWEIEGEVVKGDQRGRLLGFPTANVAIPDGSLEPRLGVYAIRAAFADAAEPVWIDGVANIGMRPTFGKDRVSLEAHLFGFAEDIYGRALRIAFIDFVRPEQKFNGLDALKAQIAADSKTARGMLSADNPRA
jgi:riboflavin kinase/FMN adenylyltransferase